MVVESKILGNTFESAYKPNVEKTSMPNSENQNEKSQSNSTQSSDTFTKSNLPENQTYKPVFEKSSKSNTEKPEAENSEKSDAEKKANGELSDSEKKVVEDLKARDNEVRNHEQAHLAAGGGLVKGGASYSYQTGPDNKRYAIGGEVQIDISPVDGNPQATIMKMQQVKAAAMAPSDPSSQDRAVAARASQLESQARAELNSKNSQQNIENQKKYSTIDSAALKKTYGKIDSQKQSLSMLF